MAHGMTCTQLLGKETKNRNGKRGLPGWPYQNEDDYKGREEHATQNCSFMLLPPLVHSLNCKTKPFSKDSPKLKPDQISPALNRKEYI